MNDQDKLIAFLGARFDSIEATLDSHGEKIQRMLDLGRALSDEIMAIRTEINVFRKSTGKVHTCRFDPDITVIGTNGAKQKLI